MRFSDYVAEQLAAAAEGAGDVARAGIADIGDSYQEILTGHSAISAPDGTAGTMETVTPPQPEAPMSDSQLAELIAAQPEQQPQAPQPEIDIE